MASESESLPETGSGSVALTEALADRLPVAADETSTVRITLLLVPAAMVPRLQVTVPEEWVHVDDPGTVPRKLVEVGTDVVTVTPLASEGPLLAVLRV